MKIEAYSEVKIKPVSILSSKIHESVPILLAHGFYPFSRNEANEIIT
jgi:hypothetical protein